MLLLEGTCKLVTLNSLKHLQKFATQLDSEVQFNAASLMEHCLILEPIVSFVFLWNTPPSNLVSACQPARDDGRAHRLLLQQLDAETLDFITSDWRVCRLC
jgi:hypothetical protein